MRLLFHKRNVAFLLRFFLLTSCAFWVITVAINASILCKWFASSSLFSISNTIFARLAFWCLLLDSDCREHWYFYIKMFWWVWLKKLLMLRMNFALWEYYSLLFPVLWSISTRSLLYLVICWLRMLIRFDSFRMLD